MRKGIIYVYFNKAKYEKEGVEKYYVGQTIETMEQRAGKDGRGYRTFDKTCNSKFARSIRKWGWNAFEGRVLEEVDEEDLNELEKFYIKYFDSYKNGYNTTLGGEGTRGHNPYANKTEEEIKEIKEKISKSLSITGKKRFQDPKEIEKLSKAQRKRWENTEERKKITGELNPRAKSVYCNELDIVFSYIKIAEKYCKNILNIKIGPIRDVCNNNGKIKSTGEYDWTKLTWSWAKNLDKEILNNAEYIDDKCYKEIINGNKKYLENPKIKKIQNKRLLFEKNGNAKSVYCNELNIVFSYIKIAEKYCKNVLNSKIGQISLTCNGKRKSTGTYNGKKLHWSWIENVDKKTLDKAEYIDNKKYEEIINERKKCNIPRELNYYTTSVYCNELNILFSYVTLAEKYCINILNIKAGIISAVCNGERKSSGKLSNGTKLTWSWTKNLDKEILNNAEYIDSKKYEEIINERKKCGIPYELNCHTTSVYCNELNVSFSYITLAEKYCKNVLNIKIGQIDRACNGKIKYSGKLSDGTKLTWSWTENLDKETLNNAEYIDDKCYEEIINGNKKYLENPEIKKIQNKRLLYELNPHTKSVYCNELDIIFSYIKLAVEYCRNVLNIKIGPIRNVCNGKAKYSGKLSDGTELTWSWTENLDKETLDNAEYIDSKKYEEIINEKMNN